MKIIIKESNRNRLNDEFAIIQKRTTARNICVDDLFRMIEHIESSLGIPKNKMLGISADVDYNAQDFPKAYKYTPESTQVIIEKVSSGWALTGIERYRCRLPKSRYILKLPDVAKEAIIDSKSYFT